MEVKRFGPIVHCDVWTCFQVPNGGLVTNLFLIYWNHEAVPGTNLSTWSKGNQFFSGQKLQPKEYRQCEQNSEDFFSHRNSIHIVTLTFEPIPKQQIRIFTNFLTNQNKYGQSSLFTFYYVFWQKQSDWKMLCKVRIRSFGIGCWIRWARYWWLKMNMYTLLTVNLFYLFFFTL